MGFLRIGGHDRLRMLLSSYIDGQVTSAESARVERYLAGCRECMAELENLRATVGLLRALPELAIPCSFTLDAVPSPVLTPWRFGWATGMAATAAAVLLFALIAGDLTGLLRQMGQVMRLQGEIVVEAPVVVAAAAAAMAAPAPKAPEATDREVVKEVSTEDAAALDKDAAPPIAAMAAPTSDPAATASTTGEGGVARTVERGGAVEETVDGAPVADASTIAALPSRELAPEPTPQTQAKSQAPIAAPQVPQQDAGAVSVPVETGDQGLPVSSQTDDLATGAALADGGASDLGDGGVSLPLLELELASGALLALLVLVFVWLAVRRQRAL